MLANLIKKSVKKTNKRYLGFIRSCPLGLRKNVFTLIYTSSPQQHYKVAKMIKDTYPVIEIAELNGYNDVVEVLYSNKSYYNIDDMYKKTIDILKNDGNIILDEYDENDHIKRFVKIEFKNEHNNVKYMKNVL